MKASTQEWINRAKDDLDVAREIIDIAHRNQYRRLSLPAKY